MFSRDCNHSRGLVITYFLIYIKKIEVVDCYVISTNNTIAEIVDKPRYSIFPMAIRKPKIKKTNLLVDRSLFLMLLRSVCC